jgi:hypothetical protein
VNARDRHNLHSSDDGPLLVMALRAGRPEHTPELEPVLIAHEGTEVFLILDDGERLVFDVAELRSALGTPDAGLRAA